MAARLLFRCERCSMPPGPETQRTLERQLRDRSFGEYLDARPGGWLIWTGGGPLGQKRYACPRHREDLTDHLRTHYGAVHSGVFKTGPYRALSPAGFSEFDERALAELLGGDASPRAGGGRE